MFTQIVPLFNCTYSLHTEISSHCFNAWQDRRDKLLMRQRRRIVRHRFAVRDARSHSNTQPPHAVAPDAPWVQIVARHPVQGAEWDEREDYTVWTSRQGHPVHQGRLLSRWLHLVPRSLPLPFPGPSPPSAPSHPSPCDHLPSSLFSLPPGRPFVILFHAAHPPCADTSQQPTTSYYSKIIFLPEHALTLCTVKINQGDFCDWSMCRVLL